MCIYIYVYIHVCVYTYIIWVYVYMCMCICVHVLMRLSESLYEAFLGAKRDLYKLKGPGSQGRLEGLLVIVKKANEGEKKKKGKTKNHGLR